MLRNWSASRPLSIGTPTDRSLCHIFVALSDQWISTHLSLLCTINGFANIVTFRHQHTFRCSVRPTDINILVGTVYGRQRLQNLDMPLSASRLQLLIETPADRSLCHTSVALSHRRIST